MKWRFSKPGTKYTLDQGTKLISKSFGEEIDILSHSMNFDNLEASVTYNILVKNELQIENKSERPYPFTARFLDENINFNKVGPSLLMSDVF